VTSIYHLISWFGVPFLFNYWAILSVDIFFVIMWLVGFALLASEAAYWYDQFRYFGVSNEGSAWYVR